MTAFVTVDRRIREERARIAADLDHVSAIPVARLAAGRHRGDFHLAHRPTCVLLLLLANHPRWRGRWRLSSAGSQFRFQQPAGAVEPTHQIASGGRGQRLIAEVVDESLQLVGGTAGQRRLQPRLERRVNLRRRLALASLRSKASWPWNQRSRRTESVLLTWSNGRRSGSRSISF